jgi:hypothetical protein
MDKGLDDRGSITGGGTDFSLHHHIQTGPRVSTSSYTMSSGGKSVGARLWPFTYSISIVIFKNVSSYRLLHAHVVHVGGVRLYL